VQRYYDTLAEYDRDGFHIIVDKTYEDLDPKDMFDDSIDPDTGLPYYDIEEIYQDINNGRLDWFMLRVRVFVAGVELGSDYVGGFLYKDAREVLTDGVVEDMIWSAMQEAKRQVKDLADKFCAMSLSLDQEEVDNRY
jgi:hypothetical protein